MAVFSKILVCELGAQHLSAQQQLCALVHEDELHLGKFFNYEINHLPQPQTTVANGI